MVQVLRQIETDIAQKMPIFGTEEFLASKGSDYGWFVSEDFALPFTLDARFRKLGFGRMVLTTEVVSLRGASSIEAEAQFLDAVMDLCKRREQIEVDSISTQANAVFRAVPTTSEFVHWGSYTVDLTPAESTWFERLEKKNRNRIRRAMAAGVAITITADVELVQRCLKDTMTRQRLLLFPSKAYLSTLQQKLGDKINFYVAHYNNVLQGVAVVVHNHLGGYYYYGGSSESVFGGSLNLMQYEIMRDLKSKNIPLYDLMGARIDTLGNTKIEGLQKFKESFATGMRRGYLFRQILSPLRHRVFVQAVKTYAALKGCRYEGDVIDQTQQRRHDVMAPAVQAET